MSFRPDADSCRAFLLRHGATDSNLVEPPILQGRTVDGPLSAVGRRQAEQAAACLAAESLAAVYSSPLKRAVETAETIAKSRGLVVKTIAEISEIDVGAWERRSWAEIRESEPESYANFQRDPARYGYRGGENLGQLAERVNPAILRILQVHRGESIAIVGHNVVNRVFLAHALQLPLALARLIIQENCGINIVQLRGNDLKAVTLNSVFHLR